MTQYLSLLYFTSKQTNKQKSYQGVKFYLEFGCLLALLLLVSNRNRNRNKNKPF